MISKNTSWRVVSFLTVAFGITSLIACGGPSAASPALEPSQATQGANARQSTRGPDLLYIANFQSNAVTVYAAKATNPSPLLTITENEISGTQSTCLGKDGTLYVVNENASTVAEYPPTQVGGSPQPGLILTDGLSSPAFCALDIHGNLYVTNIGQGNLLEFFKGSTKSVPLRYKGLTWPGGIAFDKAGNLYVSNWCRCSSGGANNIEIYAPNDPEPSLTITNGLTSPLGIAVDSMGTIYVVNVDAGNLSEYLAGQTEPHVVITKGLNLPVAVTIGNGRIYISNDGTNAVVEYAAGKTSPLKSGITQGIAIPGGITYAPAGHPGP